MRSNEHMLQDPNISSHAWEAPLAILYPLCSCWHGDLQHRHDCDTVILTYCHTHAISAPANLSAVCKPALNSQFPPEQKKKKLCQEAHCHGAISLTHYSSAWRAHGGPDRSTHILASHPPVLKGNGRTFNGPQWEPGRKARRVG